jgi:hypothetical protein
MEKPPREGGNITILVLGDGASDMFVMFVHAKPHASERPTADEQIE